MGRAEACRLACCKASMVDYTHCGDACKAVLSMEELEVLRSHQKQAELSVVEARTHYHSVDQHCCNTYSQEVCSC